MSFDRHCAPHASLSQTWQARFRSTFSAWCVAQALQRWPLPKSSGVIGCGCADGMRSAFDRFSASKPAQCASRLSTMRADARFKCAADRSKSNSAAAPAPKKRRRSRPLTCCSRGRARAAAMSASSPVDDTAVVDTVTRVASSARAATAATPASFSDRRSRACGAARRSATSSTHAPSPRLAHAPSRAASASAAPTTTPASSVSRQSTTRSFSQRRSAATSSKAPAGFMPVSCARGNATAPRGRADVVVRCGGGFQTDMSKASDWCGRRSSSSAARASSDATWSSARASTTQPPASRRRGGPADASRTKRRGTFVSRRTTRDAAST